MIKSPIQPTIPLDGQGKQHGFLRLPYSRDDSAWGSVMIPITVIANGVGPTALLTGANHGDEYEGPIALQNLAYDLDPADITGRVIIIPYMNAPAFRAATRTSPLDGGNLNRSFPGRADGTVTQKIAHYFHEVLVPLADVVLDFHSGGKTLDFLPMGCAHYLDNPDQQSACLAAVRAFGAPYTLMLREIDNVGMYDTEVEARGKVFVTTEMGGGGTATARSSQISQNGALNLLRQSGILAGPVQEPDTIMLDMPDGDCYHFAESAGMLEMMADMGDHVSKDQLIARIWAVDRSGNAPLQVFAHRDGLLAARHFPGLIQHGDCLAVIAVPS